MKRLKHKGKRPEFNREVLGWRDLHCSAGCVQHLAGLHLRIEFPSSVGHCTLVMTAEIRFRVFGNVSGETIERDCQIIIIKLRYLNEMKKRKM